MYPSPSRRSGNSRIVGAHVRRIPTGAHEGTWRDFARRLEQDLWDAGQPNSQLRERVKNRLIGYTADFRNIWNAIVATIGDPCKAAGPDNVRLAELSPNELRNFGRSLQAAFGNGTYRTGPTRAVYYPKTSGKGMRRIEVPQQCDLVACRAIGQVLGPFLEPRLSKNSLGGRSRTGRDHALITAANHYRARSCETVITQDLADAFPSIPLGRLWKILERQDIPRELITLVQNAIGLDAKRGLPQGNPLSGLLANAYLNEQLLKPWHRAHPETPLLLFVDDILIPCKPGDSDLELHGHLAELATSAGMRLKGHPRESIRHLRGGEEADWLGITIADSAGELRFGVADRSWKTLSSHLERCHETPDPPETANSTIRSWIGQLGSTYAPREAKARYEEVTRRAAELGFEEIPPPDTLHQHWRAAGVRFRCLRRLLSRMPSPGFSDGSARQRTQSAVYGCGEGGRQLAASPPSLDSMPRIYVWTAGECFLNTRSGAWAFHAQDAQGALLEQRTGSCLRSTNNRMELRAVVEALSAVARPSRVFFYTSSRYVLEGFRTLQRFRSHRGDLQGRSNWALWQQLSEACQRHQIQCSLIERQSGDAFPIVTP